MEEGCHIYIWTLPDQQHRAFDGGTRLSILWALCWWWKVGTWRESPLRNTAEYLVLLLMAECWYSASLKRQVTSSVKEQVPAWWYGNAGTLARTLAFECYDSRWAKCLWWLWKEALSVGTRWNEVVWVFHWGIFTRQCDVCITVCTHCACLIMFICFS